MIPFDSSLQPNTTWKQLHLSSWQKVKNKISRDLTGSRQCWMHADSKTTILWTINILHILWGAWVGTVKPPDVQEKAFSISYPKMLTRPIHYCQDPYFTHNTCTSCLQQHRQLSFQLDAMPGGATLLWNQMNSHLHQPLGFLPLVWQRELYYCSGI